jgi:hypothetical protein
MCVVAFLEGSASGAGGRKGRLLICLFNRYFGGRRLSFLEVNQGGRIRRHILKRYC